MSDDVRDAPKCAACGELLDCAYCESLRAGMEIADRDERLALAEEVATTVALYASIGLLDDVPVETRARLGAVTVAWMQATGWGAVDFGQDELEEVEVLCSPCRGGRSDWCVNSDVGESQTAQWRKEMGPCSRDA